MFADKAYKNFVFYLLISKQADTIIYVCVAVASIFLVENIISQRYNIECVCRKL